MAIVRTEHRRLPYGGAVSWFSKKDTVEVPPAEQEPPEAVAAEFPEIEPLTPDEIDWVRSTIAELGEQDVRIDDIEDLGRYYDELLTAWIRVREADRPAPDKVIDQIGLAFGQYLADQARLEWVIATGHQGPVIALYRAQGQVLLYPASMVASSWERRETGVLPALGRVTLRSVSQTP